MSNLYINEIDAIPGPSGVVSFEFYVDPSVRANGATLLIWYTTSAGLFEVISQFVGAQDLAIAGDFYTFRFTTSQNAPNTPHDLSFVFDGAARYEAVAIYSGFAALGGAPLPLNRDPDDAVILGSETDLNSILFDSLTGAVFLDENADGNAATTSLQRDPLNLPDFKLLPPTPDAPNPEVNLPPTLVDDSFELNEDDVLNDSVATNDSDPNRGSLTYQQLSAVTVGSLDFRSDGSFTYTPPPEFSGQATFTYQVVDGEFIEDATVTLTINPVNDPPVAQDDKFSPIEDVAFAGFVGGNDSDPDSANLTYSLVSGPSSSAFNFTPSGNFTFTSAPDFFGQTSFTYAVSDGVNSDTAVVTLNVAGVNDPPVAGPDSFTTQEDMALQGDVSPNASDIDSASLTFFKNTDPANGQVTVNSNGTFTYTPNPNFAGADAFNYGVSDGAETAIARVTVTVTPENDAPVAVFTPTVTVFETEGLVRPDPLLGVQDVDNAPGDLSVVFQSLSTSGTPLSSIPTLDSAGAIDTRDFADDLGEGDRAVLTFNYLVSDPSGASTPASVVVNVDGVGTPPDVTDDQFEGNEDATIDGDVSLNDTDPDGGQLTFSQRTLAKNGTVAFTTTGSFVYTPDPNFFGTDSFTYFAIDATS